MSYTEAYNGQSSTSSSIATSPASSPRPRSRPKRSRILTADEVLAVLRKLEGHLLYSIVALDSATGRGELLVV